MAAFCNLENDNVFFYIQFILDLVRSSIMVLDLLLKNNKNNIYILVGRSMIIFYTSKGYMDQKRLRIYGLRL